MVNFRREFQIKHHHLKGFILHPTAASRVPFQISFCAAVSDFGAPGAWQCPGKQWRGLQQTFSPFVKINCYDL